MARRTLWSCRSQTRSTLTLAAPGLSWCNDLLVRRLFVTALGVAARVDKVALLERYVLPLLATTNKIQQEANGNQQLRQALNSLDSQLQHQGVARF